MEFPSDSCMERRYSFSAQPSVFLVNLHITTRASNVHSKSLNIGNLYLESLYLGWTFSCPSIGNGLLTVHPLALDIFLSIHWLGLWEKIYYCDLTTITLWLVRIVVAS